METILFIKLALAAIGAGIALWFLFLRGHEDAEREALRRLQQDGEDRGRDRGPDDAAGQDIHEQGNLQNSGGRDPGDG